MTEPCAWCRHQNANHRLGLPCHCGCDRFETADDKYDRLVTRRLTALSDFTKAVDELIEAARDAPGLTEIVSRVEEARNRVVRP